MDYLENLIKIETEKRDELIAFVDRRSGKDSQIILDLWNDLYKKYAPKDSEKKSIYAWRYANMMFKEKYCK